MASLGCGPRGAHVTDELVGERPPELVGTYSYSMVGWSLSLTLSANGNYTSGASTCFGPSGDATGTWRRQSRRVLFTPAEETGVLEGYLRNALVDRRPDGRWSLRTNGDDYLLVRP